MILKGNKSMGAFSLNDLAATIFGEGNVDALKQQAQATATTLALNAAGQYVQTNPDAMKALTDSGSDSFMTTVDKFYEQYKIPVIIAGVLISGLFGYAIYNMIQSGKGKAVAKKANPVVVKAKKKSKKKKKVAKPDIEIEEDDFDIDAE